MSILRAASIALVVFVCPFLGAAQVRPQFEVTAIKPAAVELSGDFVLGLNANGSQVHISWSSLADLVNMAYRVKRYQISGPSWIGADHFTVDAKIPDGFTTRQVPEMLQSRRCLGAGVAAERPEESRFQVGTRQGIHRRACH